MDVVADLQGSHREGSWEVVIRGPSCTWLCRCSFERALCICRQHPGIVPSRHWGEKSDQYRSLVSKKDVEVRDLIPIGEDFPELENSFMICIQLRPALLLVQANQSLPSGAIIIFDPRRSRISFLRRLILIQFVIRKSEENVASAKGRARLARVKILGIDRGTHAW